MLHLFLIYDITNDRIRTRVATICEDYGLDRIQYSAFYGRLSRNHQEELMLKIGNLLNDEPAQVQLIPVGQIEWAKRLTLQVEAKTDVG